ncbi:helix-turn-helix domain-containing protein [Actinomycetospora corticicola]|uniref:Transcriptional regulator GlxA family with amidase domain n=1 Tax=Actinomycetospora corticicola TaxID=663602 RepID=A0A7Y9E0R1_9PSEU|nr:helix-turn-helix domain-containing protein [Actinomycetospora corticicola]NYD39124.1 transcriptional regulator GlxA family with amidase domain [Actinomycetospora corticicola]
MTHVVAVLALPPVVGFDLAIPPQVFGTAERDCEPLYDVRVCGLAPGPVPTTAGYALHVEHGPEALAAADTVLVPGTHFVPARRDGVLPAEVHEALARVPEGARWMSICTGAFVLAAAGRLAGRRATTHWARAAQFRRLYPDVEVDEDVLFVDEGDLATSAGLAAGLDLCLHVVRRDHGAAVANEVARHLVVAPWRDGGQAQFIERPVPVDDDGSTGPTRTWARERLSEPLDVATLARHAAMSPRTFARRFRAETGTSPHAWILAQRIAHARHLLESTDLAIDRVAADAGLGTTSSLRAHLAADVGLSPVAYRRTYRASPRTATNRTAT